MFSIYKNRNFSTLLFNSNPKVSTSNKIPYVFKQPPHQPSFKKPFLPTPVRPSSNYSVKTKIRVEKEKKEQQTKQNFFKNFNEENFPVLCNLSVTHLALIIFGSGALYLTHKKDQEEIENADDLKKMLRAIKETAREDFILNILDEKCLLKLTKNAEEIHEVIWAIHLCIGDQAIKPFLNRLDRSRIEQIINDNHSLQKATRGIYGFEGPAYLLQYLGRSHVNTIIEKYSTLSEFWKPFASGYHSEQQEALLNFLTQEDLQYYIPDRNELLKMFAQCNNQNQTLLLEKLGRQHLTKLGIPLSEESEFPYFVDFGLLGISEMLHRPSKKITDEEINTVSVFTTAYCMAYHSTVTGYGYANRKGELNSFFNSMSSQNMLNSYNLNCIAFSGENLLSICQWVNYFREADCLNQDSLNALIDVQDIIKNLETLRALHRENFKSYEKYDPDFHENYTYYGDEERHRLIKMLMKKPVLLNQVATSDDFKNIITDLTKVDEFLQNVASENSKRSYSYRRFGE